MAQPAPGRKPKPRSLKKLALEQLGIAIQVGGGEHLVGGEHLGRRAGNVGILFHQRGG